MLTGCSPLQPDTDRAVRSLTSARPARRQKQQGRRKDRCASAGSRDKAEAEVAQNLSDTLAPLTSTGRLGFEGDRTDSKPEQPTNKPTRSRHQRPGQTVVAKSQGTKPTPPKSPRAARTFNQQGDAIVWRPTSGLPKSKCWLCSRKAAVASSPMDLPTDMLVAAQAEGAARTQDRRTFAAPCRRRVRTQRPLSLT